MRGRAVPIAAAVVVVAAGLLIRFVVGGPIGAFGGDVLYAVLIFLLVLIAAPPARPLVAGGVTLAICSAVELLQLSAIPQQLARSVPGASLVLGTTFGWLDLLGYTVGTFAAVGISIAVRRRAAISGPGSSGAP